MRLIVRQQTIKHSTVTCQQTCHLVWLHNPYSEQEHSKVEQHMPMTCNYFMRNGWKCFDEFTLIKTFCKLSKYLTAKVEIYYYINVSYLKTETLKCQPSRKCMLCTCSLHTTKE